jgi:DNA helicase IV
LSKCSLSLYTFDDIIQKGISHFLNYQVLIIDEFQDFLKFDFAAELISSFSSRKTRFFGDHINQSISESEIQLEEFFNETTLTPILFNLNLNIRNTKEIIDGTKKILNVEKDDSYNSNSIRGVPIKYTVLNSIEKAVKEIIDRHQRSKPSVLIACLNSLDELGEIYNLTLSYDFITVLTANESKGLEWDYGYVFKLRSYPDKTEIKELYVALTRSLVYSEVFYELSEQDFSVLQFISENG